MSDSLSTAPAAEAPDAASGAAPLLSVDGVTVRFGGIVALNKVSFDVPRQKVLGLIGPNGAGKTTLFNCLSRLYEPNEGDIRFDGKSVLKMRPHDIAPLGIGRTFQNLALFERMSVLQNVLVGVHNWTGTGFLSNALRLPRVRQEEQAVRDHAMEVIRFLNLEPIIDQPVAGQPFGTLKRVELARALAGKPRLLLMDEPAGGLNHEEIEELADVIRHIRDRLNVTILLVEHHMGLVMNVSDHVVALDFGAKLAEGTPEEVRADPEVIRAYLGEDV